MLPKTTKSRIEDQNCKRGNGKQDIIHAFRPEAKQQRMAQADIDTTSTGLNGTKKLLCDLNV